MTRWASDAAQFHEAAEAWEAAGVDCVWINAGEESNDPLRLIKRLARFTFTTDLLRNELCKAVTPATSVSIWLNSRFTQASGTAWYIKSAGNGACVRNSQNTCTTSAKSFGGGRSL